MRIPAGFLIAGCLLAIFGQASQALEIHGMMYAWFDQNYNVSYFAQDVPEMLEQSSADWVGVYISWFQASPQSNFITKSEDTLTDDGIRALVKQIRSVERSAKVMLKVIITLPGNASMFISPTDPTAWFKSYRDLLMPLARLAAETGAEALCIGVELPHLTVRPEFYNQWRSIISDIRSFYSGQLTYSSLCWIEYEKVTFWADLDWIGLDAYWNLTALIPPSELSAPDLPPQAALVKAWETQLGILAKWRASRPDLVKKKLVFTEVGYPAASLCVTEPSAPMPMACTGEWTPDPTCPLHAWQALFESLQNIDNVLDGLFAFYWGTPTQSDGPGGRVEQCFYSVRHSPALDAIQEFFHADESRD